MAPSRLSGAERCVHLDYLLYRVTCHCLLPLYAVMVHMSAQPYLQTNVWDTPSTLETCTRLCKAHCLNGTNCVIHPLKIYVPLIQFCLQFATLLCSVSHEHTDITGVNLHKLEKDSKAETEKKLLFCYYFALGYVHIISSWEQSKCFHYASSNEMQAGPIRRVNELLGSARLDVGPFHWLGNKVNNNQK